MAELAWRKEPPDKPGWWWARSNQRQDGPLLLLKEESGRSLAIIGHSLNPVKVIEEAWEWAGPIEPPGREG